jgi:hypothetical protein
MLSGKQEAKMNWANCTDMRKQPIYVNIENATQFAAVAAVSNGAT